MPTTAAPEHSARTQRTEPLSESVYAPRQVHPKEPVQPRTVVCLGDSNVRGQVSVSFVDILRQRLSEDRFHLVNAGVNGDLAYNVLKRLDVVLTQKPDFVVILVGTNDVNATLTPRMTRGYRLLKGLPEQPGPEWYRANMLNIIRLLKDQTPARIAVTSHPVLGEDLASVANDRIRNYSSCSSN